MDLGGGCDCNCAWVGDGVCDTESIVLGASSPAASVASCIEPLKGDETALPAAAPLILRARRVHCRRIAKTNASWLRVFVAILECPM